MYRDYRLTLFLHTCVRACVRACVDPCVHMRVRVNVYAHMRVHVRAFDSKHHAEPPAPAIFTVLQKNALDFWLDIRSIFWPTSAQDLSWYDVDAVT